MPVGGDPFDGDGDSVQFQLGPQVATLAPLPLPPIQTSTRPDSLGLGLSKVIKSPFISLSNSRIFPVATPSAALGIASSAASQAILGALDQKADVISHNCNQPLGTKLGSKGKSKPASIRQSKRIMGQARVKDDDEDSDTDEPDEADDDSDTDADDDWANPDGSDMERED